VRYRGATNVLRPKKGYRIELEEKRPLVGMRKDDDWSLFAMYMDFTRMRIKLSFDLWNKIQRNNNYARLPNMEYVRIYINNKYQGLYLLAEKNDRKMWGLDKEKKGIKSSFVIKAILPTSYNYYEKDKWRQIWPNDKKGREIKDKILPKMFTFINDSTDKEFYGKEKGIYTMYERNNLVDFYVFNYFVNHGDFWIKNYLGEDLVLTS